MNNKLLALCALAAPFCLSSAAFAQQDTGDSIFEEITVTATKRAQNIYDVPVAVSAFTEEMIIKQGITDLTDVGKFVPNMTVTGFSAGHVSSINVFLRGIGLQDHLITTDPGVGVYVDGVYLGRQVGQNWSLSNIERVEVLRGPQGTLYGRNSIGGAINIITNKPGDESGGRVTLTAGSRGRLNGDFYWNTRLSDSFAASFTGSYMSRDGVGDFINFDAGVEVGEMEEWAGRVAAKWDPTEDFSVLVTYDKNDGEGGLRPYTTLIDEVPTGLLYGLVGARNSDLAADPYDNAGAFYFDTNGNLVSQADVTNEADGWSITADWAMTETLAWKLIYSDRSSEYTSGLDDDSIGFIGGSADPTDPTLGVQFQYPEVGFADQTSTELQLFGKFDNWDFVAGLYYFEEEGGNDQNPNFFLGGAGRHLNFQEAESKAIYANVGFQATDRLRLSVGARHTQDDKFALTNIGFIESSSRDWSETSWEIAAAWDLNDRMNLYGTIQNGYQSGQYPPRPFCLFVDPNCYVANDNVTAINYEVGLKGRPADRLSMSVAVFYTDYSDLPYQVSDNTGGGFNTVNIIVDQTSTGLEWESAWAATDQFRLYATIGYIDVDVDDPNPRIVAPLTPELTASISPEFTQPLANGAEMVWRLDWSYRDEMFGLPFNDVPITVIDSRSLINFDIAYHSPDGRWTLAAFGRNATDEKYDNARLLPNDYVLQILNNDRSEFGLRAVYNFD